ncbi:MAG: hypothetical protein MJ180_02935 [Candidatus Gastranaerophilales bacterium]|nr:hypothetical protein [Candidatus Gastranaerophilales bacterium]
MTEKKFERWYDKDEDLSLVMRALELADEDVKLSIAADLIQMVMANREVEGTDNFIEELNEEYIPVRRRWYDKFATLLSAVEMLKHLDPAERAVTLKEAINSLIYFQSKKGEGSEDD